MAPDSPIGGHEAMEPLDHPKAMEGRRMPSMAMHGSHYFSVSGIVCLTSNSIEDIFGLFFTYICEMRLTLERINLNL